MTSPLLPPLRIVLSGYYGFNNTGDEAVLAGLVQALRQTPGAGASRLQIIALSGDPQATERDYRHDPGFRSVSRSRISSLLRAVSSCDLLASGGGSLLQDVTSARSIFYYLGVVKAAQLMGKKTMLIAQGVGPLRLPRSRRLTAAVANRCSAITVRDAASAALLREIGVSRIQPVVTADPALLLGAESPARFAGRIAFSLRDWTRAGEDLQWRVAHALPAGMTALDSMRMSVADDFIHAATLKQVQAILPRLPVHSEALARKGRSLLNGLLTYAAESELVIGMRLHALILAAACGTPSVALSYDPKIDAFMRESGQEDAIFDIRDHSADVLAGLVGRIWADRANRAADLSARLPALRQAALRNAEIALSLIDR